MQQDECRAKFELVFRKLDRIDEALRGNGTSGVLLRLDRLERPQRARAKLGWMVLGALIAAVVGAAVAAVTNGVTP